MEASVFIGLPYVQHQTNNAIYNKKRMIKMNWKKQIVATMLLGAVLCACGKGNEPKLLPRDRKEQQSKPETTPNQGDKTKDKQGDNKDGKQGESDKRTDKRPSDYNMGARSYAKWRVSEDEYYKDFDLETLILNGNTDKYTAEYMAKFVSFFSSDINGEQYMFTAEDLKKVKIHDIKFVNSQDVVTFTISYKDVKSKTATSLPIRNEEYYARKLTVNKDFVSTVYMRGVYEHVSVFLGSIINYDRNVYAVELQSPTSKERNDNSNTISLLLSVKHQKTDRVLAENVRVAIEGFKSLNALAQEMKIAHSHDMLTYFKTKMKDVVSGDVKHKLKDLEKVFMPKALYTVRTQELKFEQNKIVGHGERSMLDVYLENPRFELEYAVLKLESFDLLLKVKLVGVNDISLDNVSFEFVVPKVRDK